MPSQSRPSSTWQLFVLATALLLCVGSLHSASAQIPDTSELSNPKSPNPTVDTKRLAGKRSDNRSRRTSSNPSHPSPGTRTDDKQQAIEQAIADGNAARDNNNYEQALSHYQRVTKTLNPLDPRAVYGLGNLYADLYCHDSAIEAYRSALNLKKDYLEALIGLGYAYSGKERYEDAEKQFREALKLKRNSVEANVGLGRVYIAEVKYQEAITQIKVVLDSTSVEAKDRAAAHVALGDVYWKQEKRQEAIAQFEEAIRLKPDLAVAYIELGNAQALIASSKIGSFASVNEINMQDMEAMHETAKRAADTLEDAKKYNYNHPNLYKYIAIALVYQLRYDDAIKQLDDYFTEINRLETLISPRVAKCGGGFDYLKAEGYLYVGLVYYTRGYLEPDARRKNDFFDKAIEQFNLAVKAKGDYASAYSMIGYVYLFQNRHEEAISQFNKAIPFSTEERVRASLYQSVGQTYATLGRYDEAIRNVQESIKRNPNDPLSYDALASIYISQGKLEETIAQLRKANEIRAQLKIESAANPHPYYYLGSFYVIRHMQTGSEEDFNEAVKALREAIKIRPKFALAYQALGLAYDNHGDADEALENYKKAIEYDPKNPQYYFNMAGVYYYRKGNNDAAIGLLKQAIGIKPDYGQAYWRLGNAYHRKKDDTEAIKQLLNAIKYDPKFLQSYIDLVYLYRLQKNYPEAIKLLTTAIEIAPTDPRPYQHLGIVYHQSSNADEALTNYNRAVEYDPKNPVNYFYIASVYLELKHDNEAAIKPLLKAIEADPKYVDAYPTLAGIYRDKKNYPEAIKYLTTAIGIAPAVPLLYKELARVYEAQGKNEDAIHYYEEALKRLKPDDSWTKNLYLGRIERLRGHYDAAIGYFQKLTPAELPGQLQYEVGIIHVVSKNKRAALEQYQQLVKLKSPFAEELLKKINEMK